MDMVHVAELLPDEPRDLDLAFPLRVGAGSVDPRLLEPLHGQPDIEVVVAAYARD